MPRAGTRRSPITGEYVDIEQYNLDIAMLGREEEAITQEESVAAESASEEVPAQEAPEPTCVQCGTTAGVTQGANASWICEDHMEYCEGCEGHYHPGDKHPLSHTEYCADCDEEYGQVCQACNHIKYSSQFVPISNLVNVGQEFECIDCVNIAIEAGRYQKQEPFGRNIVDITRLPERFVRVEVTHRDVEKKIIFNMSEIDRIMEYIQSGQITGRVSRDNEQYILDMFNEAGTARVMPKYRRMPRNGCMYLCGRDPVKETRSGPICEECDENPLCDECTLMGSPQCPRCFKSYPTYINKRATTTRPQRIYPSNYHPQQHIEFKTSKYRLEGEHPYMYYGVEIEVELPNSVDRTAFAETIVYATNGLFVAERDGSLNNGVEFISRPTSYLRWTHPDTVAILQEMYQLFELFGVHNVSQNSAGMHVHMSKKFFQKNSKKSVEQQKEDMAWIFEYYDTHIEKLSRRKLNKFCTSKRGIMQGAIKQIRLPVNNYTITIGKEAPVQSMGSGDSHHHMLSETHHTLEVRTFKTPSEWEQIISAIEICRNLAHFSREYTIEGHNLQQILMSKNSPYLDRYMKKEKLDFSDTKKLIESMVIER